MKQYLVVLLCGSLLGALCTAAAGARLEKYVRYLSSLLCILLIISPFKEFDLKFTLEEESLPSAALPWEGDTLSSLAWEMAEKEICRGISSQLFGETGITPARISIDMDWTAQEPVVQAVRLVLSAQDAHRKEEVVAWAENAYGVPCHVTEGEEAS